MGVFGEVIEMPLEIGHEWTSLGTNGENVGFFHSCPIQEVGHEWGRSGTNGAGTA
jgi:hypothetical protein